MLVTSRRHRPGSRTATVGEDADWRGQRRSAPGSMLIDQCVDGGFGFLHRQRPPAGDPVGELGSTSAIASVPVIKAVRHTIVRTSRSLTTPASNNAATAG